MINNFFIGIDVGGTKIYGGLVSRAGEVMANIKTATPPNASASAVISLIEKTVRTLAKDAKLSPNAIRGVGIAIPGIVDNSGKIIVTPNIGLSGIDLKKILGKKLKTRISVGNDVNMGVLGERWLGAGRKAKNIVGLFPGTGVGGGVVINNEFMAGAQGAAAELGHIQIDPRGPACTCGNQGCLEAVAGRWAIERDIRAGIKQGQRSVITELAGKDLKQIKSGTLAKALKANDALATEVMGRASSALARACVSLNHVFNPDMFLFGGGVIEACGEFMLPTVEKALKEDPFFKHLKTPSVVRAKLGDDAVMLGAVAMAKIEAGEKLDGKYKLYPTLKAAGAGKVLVKGKSFTNSFFVRADGKLKLPKDLIKDKISDNDLDDICKKGPDVLVIARGKNKAALTPKAKKLLNKKHIALQELPLRQAASLFNTLDERRAFLFLN